jgi:hypothetical protein
LPAACPTRVPRFARDDPMGTTSGTPVPRGRGARPTWLGMEQPACDTGALTFAARGRSLTAGSAAARR